jgi:hypothetical protein
VTEDSEMTRAYPKFLKECDAEQHGVAAPDWVVAELIADGRAQTASDVVMVEDRLVFSRAYLEGKPVSLYLFCGEINDG